MRGVKIKMEKANKKQIAKISIFITTIFIIFMSVSFAFINLTLQGTKRQVIEAGTLSLELDEDENNLTIQNALPMYDEVGMIQEAFTFRLINNGTTSANYKVKLVEIGTGTLSKSDVKYGLTKDGVKTIGLLSDIKEGVIDSGTIGASPETIEYSLRLWIKDDVTDNETISGKSLSYRVDVEVGQIVEQVKYVDASGANEPVLTSGMIAVTYDTQKGWVTADTTTEWYNYTNQMWANAVTVSTEEARNTYKSATPGTPVSMDDINTMWVWIPRYEYQYTDLGTSYAGGTKALPGEIKVNFISASQITPSDSSVYKIPEGFTFGEENIPGFWMAKFETSTLETCVAATNVVDTGCDFATFTLQVKPNVTSWRGARVSTMFEASRLMQSSTNAPKYGFTTVGNGTMDVHMLKNTEWGIVAMLSQSRYGKYGNSSYTGANKEVYQNKSSSYITGMSNGTPGTSTTTNPQITYDTPDTGYGASTTGTIYGVYDMSGGAYEYVMGNLNDYSGQSSTYNSGFSGTNGPSTGAREWPGAQYYDLYTSNTASDAYKAGDATYETSGWYSDSNTFLTSSNPWFGRGGNCDSSASAGVFDMTFGSGESYPSTASRLAIKP